jgi:plasmid stabilization system protein ParE
MKIKWNKTAVKNLISALEFMENAGFTDYSIRLEKEIISVIQALPNNYLNFQLDRFKENNDGSFRAFIIENYRISFRVKANEIHILRIRHTSKKPIIK